MSYAELDNPFWSALTSIHRAWAQRVGEVARYPAELAPFLGVMSAGVDLAPALGSLVPAGDTVHMLGVWPTTMPSGWHLTTEAPLLQMVCERPLQVAPGPEAVPLTASHLAELHALVQRVYPHYFRARTPELGRYFGLYDQGQLAAVIGERLGSEQTRELSAICTHPAFTGRGYARRLTALLANEILQSGRLPFLHVSHLNVRAKALYEQLGFRTRREIPFCALRSK